MKEPDQVIDSKEKDVNSGRLRTGLLLFGSAVFGGIAVALWNRRTLGKMQNPPTETPKKISPVEDDAIY